MCSPFANCSQTRSSKKFSAAWTTVGPVPASPPTIAASAGAIDSRVFTQYPERTWGVAQIVENPRACRPRASVRPSSTVLTPSSIPGRR